MDTDFSAVASMVQNLMENPALGYMMGTLLSGDGKGEKTAEAGQTAEGAETDSKNEEGASPAKTVSSFMPKKYDKARAEKLLNAIKPYLNPSRCAIIDRCVSVMQITDVMGALQGLEGFFQTGKNGRGGDT